jgi:hypothetical protein
MQEKYNLDLSKEELQLILEALISTSSIDIHHRGYLEDCEKMIDIASRIRILCQNIPVENVFLFKKDELWDGLSQKIIDLFPELLEYN